MSEPSLLLARAQVYSGGMNTAYLTAAQAAERLGVTKRCVTSLIARGHLPATEPLGPGRGYLIPAASIAARLRKTRENRLPKGGRPRKSKHRNDLKNLANSG